MKVIPLREVHDVWKDTGFKSPSKRPTTGDPTFNPTAGIGPPEVVLGVASWGRDIALELFNLTFVFRFYCNVILIIYCLFRLYFDKLVVSYDSCSLV